MEMEHGENKRVLIIQNGAQSGERYFINQKTITIGRDPESDIQILESSVSRQHARLIFDDDQVIIEDLGSRNGTFVQGNQIEQPALLKAEQIIRVGLIVHLRYIVSFDPESEPEIVAPFIQSYNVTEVQETPPGKSATDLVPTLRIPGNGPAPYCLIITGGKQRGELYPLVKGRHPIGRAADNEIQLHNPDISNYHAVIHIDDSGILLLDNESQNGTFVNNVAVLAPTRIEAGDMLQIGATVLAEVEVGIPTGPILIRFEEDDK